MHTPDNDLPPEHPGNHLRMKLTGTNVRMPDSFGAVMDTARKNSIAPHGISDEDATEVVKLFLVARAIDAAPPGEVRRVQS